METGMMVAAMDQNINIDCGYAITKTKEGEYKPKCEIGYHRYADRFVAKKVKNVKKYDFMRDIVVNCYFKAIDNQKGEKVKRKRLFRAPQERPDRDEIIEKSVKFSRFDK